MTFFDTAGRRLTWPVRDQTDGYFPTTHNDGVGLLPLSNAGVGGDRGMPGQAVVSLQYADAQCDTHIALARLSLASGTLLVPLALSGGDFKGCFPPVIAVNPFQPPWAAP